MLRPPQRLPRLRRSLFGAATTTVLLAAAAAVSGCGDVSRSDASSALSSQLATATGFPSSVDKNAIVTCIVGKLYDSGTFTSAEVQKIVTANSISDLDQALQTKYETNVNTPCLQTAIGGGTSTPGAASSTSSSSSDAAASTSATS